MEIMEKPKLTLEQYDRFFQEPDRRAFSLDQLNQIVLMHGFLKLKTKLAIMEGLSTVDLMHPKRSTLRDKAAYPCAPLSINEVVADIASLGWQECPIGSVATFGSAAAAPPTAEGTAASIAPPTAEGTAASIAPASGLNLLAAAAAATTAVSATGKTKKRKRRTTPKMPLLTRD